MTKRKTTHDSDDYTPTEVPNAKEERPVKKRTTRSSAKENEDETKDENIQITEEMGVNSRILETILNMSNSNNVDSVSIRSDSLLFTSLIIEEFLQHKKYEENELEREVKGHMGKLTQYFEQNKSPVASYDLGKILGTTNKNAIRNAVYKARANKLIALTEPLWKSDSLKKVRPEAFRYVGASSKLSWEHVISDTNVEKVKKFIKKNDCITLRKTVDLLSVTMNQARFFFGHFISKPKTAKGRFCIKTKLKDDVEFEFEM